MGSFVQKADPVCEGKVFIAFAPTATHLTAPPTGAKRTAVENGLNEPGHTRTRTPQK